MSIPSEAYMIQPVVKGYQKGGAGGAVLALAQTKAKSEAIKDSKNLVRKAMPGAEVKPLEGQKPMDDHEKPMIKASGIRNRALGMYHSEDADLKADKPVRERLSNIHQGKTDTSGTQTYRRGDSVKPSSRAGKPVNVSA